MKPTSAVPRPVWADVESPLWEQLEIRLSEAASIQEEANDGLPNMTSADDIARWKRDTSPSKIPWTRKAFVRLLFHDESAFRAFSAHIKNDSYTIQALRLHSAYTDLMISLSDLLPSSYRLALPRDAFPTFAVARLLSPMCPPGAPPLSIPVALIPRFIAVWETYLEDPNRSTFVGEHLPHDTRASLTRAFSTSTIWCGVLDECVARILESVYTRGFRSFVDMQSNSSYAGSFYSSDESRASSSPRDHFTNVYPTPTSSPPLPMVQDLSMSRVPSRRSSIYSDAGLSAKLRPLSMLHTNTGMPPIAPRSSSLRPPPNWASKQRAASQQYPRRVSFEDHRHPTFPPTRTTRPVPEEEDQRDSGISLKWGKR